MIDFFNIHKHFYRIQNSCECLGHHPFALSQSSDSFTYITQKLYYLLPFLLIRFKSLDRYFVSFSSFFSAYFIFYLNFALKLYLHLLNICTSLHSIDQTQAFILLFTFHSTAVSLLHSTKDRYYCYLW